MKSKHVLMLVVLIFLLGCSPFSPEDVSVESEQSSLDDESIEQDAGPIDQESAAANNEPPEPIPTVDSPTALIYPVDLQYLGAFRLPDGQDRPYTFEYGGNAMTLIPHEAKEDQLPGGLVITGHDRLPYGEMPDGDQIAEITIPQPIISDDVYMLPMAEFIQPFSDVARGHFSTLNELPRIGLAYLDDPATGPVIHIAWGAHFQEEESNAPSHGYFSIDFSNPDFQGEWFLGNFNLYAVNGYLFTIPQAWADQYTKGLPLASGRYRDGGWSGMGPNLFAYQPWDVNGNLPGHNEHVPAIPLLSYPPSFEIDTFEQAMDGYSHADEWEGAAWLVTPSGKMSVIFTGTKATGEKTWYGWANPKGAESPCIEVELRDQFTTCYLSSGSPCPQEDLTGCNGHNDYRGWWSSAFEAQILFYNPDDLAMVAAGAAEPWQPQPYARMSLEDVLFHNPDGTELEMLGEGIQAIHRIGAATVDNENGYLYVLELFAEGAKPVVHVWQVMD
ncbi:MAG: hypothetical protein V2J07_02215 [Anaerolineae bacterium]|jgi:hypothetical protein|nr:hypothetical protein [Anaerolineae bacterium]